MSERETRVLALAVMLTAGVLLFLIGPESAHDAATGLLGGAMAIGAGALRRQEIPVVRLSTAREKLLDELGRSRK